MKHVKNGHQLRNNSRDTVENFTQVHAAKAGFKIARNFVFRTIILNRRANYGMDFPQEEKPLDFSDLNIRCSNGGVVRASTYIISTLSKAEIIMESLRLDNETLVVPFGLKAVESAVLATHSGLAFKFEHLPADLHGIMDVADVFDFLGAPDALDAVLARAMVPYRNSPPIMVAEYAKSMSRHSDPDFMELVFRTMFAKAPFWSAFEVMLDNIDFSIPLALSMCRALSETFPPQMLMQAACDRLRPLTMDRAFELLGDQAWGRGCHPWETGAVLDAVIGKLIGPCAEDSATRMLRSIACACRLNSFAPIRNTTSTVNGSILTYYENHKISVLVDGYAGRSGHSRKRVAPGIEFAIDTDSVNVTVDFGKFDSLQHVRSVAARISVVTEGHCAGENWFFITDEGPRFFFDTTRVADHVQPSDELCAAVEHVPRNVQQALRAHTHDFWIRFDAFFESDMFVFGAIKEMFDSM